ncbi:MAG: NfeD family protein [Cyclobacteriaceae bacterium]
MEWLFVLGLILLGIGIIIVEVIFIPGTTIVGILGFIISIYGVYLGYEYFGTPTGHFIFAGGFLATTIAIVGAFKSGAWDRFSLKESMDGRVNDDYQVDIEVGDIGESVSSLKPIGKGIFRDQVMEVRTNGDYIRESNKIKVIRVDGRKIFVEPLN